MRQADARTLDNLQDPLGKPVTLLADNGYFSQDNVKACAERDITPSFRWT